MEIFGGDPSSAILVERMVWSIAGNMYAHIIGQSSRDVGMGTGLSMKAVEDIKVREG